MIDLGANVGDTAVACLGAAPNVDVIAVEGLPAFATYLRRNTAAYGDRCRVVESFVGPVAGVTDRGFITTGSSTGRFANKVEKGEAVDDFVTPEELLAGTDGYDQVTWKSDIDGLDIHVLVQHWDAIDSGCDTLWFEFDPPSTLGDRDDIGRLIDLLADSGRTVEAYDNLGRRIVTLEPGRAVGTGLRSLEGWLNVQRWGHITVPYLDLWAFSPGLPAHHPVGHAVGVPGVVDTGRAHPSQQVAQPRQPGRVADEQLAGERDVQQGQPLRVGCPEGGLDLGVERHRALVDVARGRVVAAGAAVGDDEVRRAVALLCAGQELPPDAGTLLVGDDRDGPRLRHPGRRGQRRGPDLGHGVLLAGVLGQEGQHARHQRDPHWPVALMARSGGLRPAMDQTMSTVSRVSRTWWTR